MANNQEDLLHDSIYLMVNNIKAGFMKFNERRMNNKETEKCIVLFAELMNKE